MPAKKSSKGKKKKRKNSKKSVSTNNVLLVLSLVAISLLGILSISIHLNKLRSTGLSIKEAPKKAEEKVAVKIQKQRYEIKEEKIESISLITPAPTETIVETQVKVVRESFVTPSPFYQRTPLPPMKKPQIAPGKKYVAVIIDDCGLDLYVIHEFLEMSPEFTFSILPYLSESYQIARFLHTRGSEIMLHLPMEPQDLANNDPGLNALLVQLPVEEISRRTELAINSLPYISGVNNHMGSEFTRHGDEMSVVLKVIAGINLFFVDSYTSQESVAYKISMSMGIPTYKRDVFLDNYEDPANFEGNLRTLIAIAKSQGQAIAIGHAKIQTAQNLKNFFHLLEDNNIELVRISKLSNR